MPAKSTAQQLPGVISADEIYSLGEFKARMKMGAHAVRQARRRGLPIKMVGRNAYVCGADWLEFVQNKGRTVDGVRRVN